MIVTDESTIDEMRALRGTPEARRPARSRRRRTRVAAVACSVVIVVTMAACSGSSSDSSDAPATTTPASPPATTRQPSGISATTWKQIDADLAGLAPQTGLLVARVNAGGTCRPIHAVDASKTRPTASQFKLLVLGALAEQIAAGKVSWGQELVVPEVRSLGNEGAKNALQATAAHARFTVEEVAGNMISISDNTAADMLIDLVGRHAVERQFAKWTGEAARNTPMLTTREMLLLHYAKGLGERYLATPAAQRERFLTEQVDPLPNADIATGYTTEPRFIDEIEWFASPDDLCRTFAGLRQLQKRPGLAPLDGVLAEEDFGVDLDATEWPTVWYKGGSEAGVLTTGWLATNASGDTYVVEMMMADPDAALSAESIPTTVKLAKRIFGLLGTTEKMPPPAHQPD